MFKLFKIDVSIDFTNFISKHITSQANSYDNVVFVSSNRRLLLYTKNELEPNCMMKSDFYTIEDFSEKIVLEYLTEDLVVHSKAERELFILDMIKNNCSEIYKQLGDDESKVFIWAKKISSLFDDIDMHMLGERLKNYQYVEAIKPAIAILENLKSMYEIYENTYRGYGYRGIYHKIFAQSDLENLKSIYGNSLFIFAGMLYFTESEKQILNKLSEFFDVDFILQTDMFERDRVYINGENYDFKTFDIVDKAVKDFNIQEEKKIKPKYVKLPEIEFFEFSNTHYNTAFFAEKIKSVSDKISDNKNPKNIGVVLPDSSSLYPLINNLDDNLPLNITMGYPFTNTDFGLFLINFLELMLDISLRSEESRRNLCDSKLLFQVLNSNIIGFLNETEIFNKLKLKLLEFQSGSFHFDDNEIFYNKILKPFLKVKNFKQLYEAFINFYKHIDLDKLSLEENKFTAQMIQLFFREKVDFLKKIGERNTDLRFVYNFLLENIKDLSIPFEGDPLTGIQIMGVLEARQISFKHLFIADVNEGILPLKNKIDPLLPESIKTEIGLNSFKEKEGLIKYHFFRMVYSADNVIISYKAGTSGLEKSIRSRFIDQLVLMEEAKNNSVKINKFFAQLPSNVVNEDMCIKKEDEIKNFFKQRIENNLISPSELDLYMDCPYKYYLHRVCDIKKPISFDSDFKANIVGTITHDILEKAFNGYIGKIIDLEDYKDIQDKAINEVKEFNKNFKLESPKSQGEVTSYLEMLSNFQFEAMKKIMDFKLKAFFKETKKSLPFKLIDTEKELKSKKYGLKGIADRIDEISESGENFIRIVDYKTGAKVKKPKKSKLDKLIDIKNKSYDRATLEIIKDTVVSIQFPAYMLMAEEIYKKNVCAEVYLLSNNGNNIIEKIKGENLEYYAEIIDYIFKHMQGSEYIFPLPGDNCRYCDFTLFCKYKGN